MSTGTVELHRVFARPPSESIARSSTPMRWPSGCRRTDSRARCITSTRRSAARTRCRSRISRTGNGHSFGGTYLELVPNERIRHTDKFDDPNLPGEMQTTITLEEGFLRDGAEHRAGRDSRT